VPPDHRDNHQCPTFDLKRGTTSEPPDSQIRGQAAVTGASANSQAVFSGERQQ
jgi:hypothetical protein